MSAPPRRAPSAYDAAYVVVAERLEAPLATLDKKLINACRAVGIPLAIGS